MRVFDVGIVVANSSHFASRFALFDGTNNRANSGGGT